MPEKAAIHAIVHGRVQGVSFRAFTQQKALTFNLTGFVRNSISGDEVEVFAEGDRVGLEKFIETLKKGPPGAAVSEITIDWPQYIAKFNSFNIRY